MSTKCGVTHHQLSSLSWDPQLGSGLSTTLTLSFATATNTGVLSSLACFLASYPSDDFLQFKQPSTNIDSTLPILGTMAEVLAVAASGAGLASLALQLPDCGVKLSKFCDEVERAPKRLRRISREMKTLGLTLQQMELLRIQYRISSTDVLAQYIELCEDSVRDIIDSTKAIEAVVMRHRLGGRI